MLTLLNIKKHLQTVKLTTLANICTYFNAEPSLLQQMLQHWVRKGCLRQCTKTPACGQTCVKCSPQITEIYEWIGNV